MVFALRPYWINRGLLMLGHRVTIEALARAGAQGRDSVRSRGLFDAGQLCCFMGRYAEAQGYLEESLAIAREVGDKARVAAVLQSLGMACVGEGDLARAQALSEEAVALAQERGNTRQLAAAINGLAQVHRMGGQLDAAEPLYEKVLTLARDLGDREYVAIFLVNLAMVSVDRGAGDRARSLLSEVLMIAEEIGSEPAVQSAVDVGAGLAAVSNEWAQAARFFGMAEAQTERTGLRRDPVDEAFLTPLIARAKHALGEHAFALAEAAGRARPSHEALTEVHAWLNTNGR